MSTTTSPRPLPDGPLYFVGIGGAGQSAIAYVLAQRGRTVRGADPGISAAARQRLESVGITVFAAHDPTNVGDAVAVIGTDAVNESNPEIMAARERGIPVFRRPEALGALMAEGRGVAISGTHGKTTTTGMTASVLMAANLDPTILIGGDLPAIGGNARNGDGEIVLAEACEAYNGFLYLHPEVAVITNVEADHLDFHGTEEHVIESFQTFVKQVEPGGMVFVCADDDKAAALAGNNTFSYERERFTGDDRMFLSYGVDDEEDLIHAADVDLSGGNPSFRLVILGQDYGRVRLKVPGMHNVRNALAAAAVGWAMEAPVEAIIGGLESFTGTGRRFEKIGDVNGILIVDDYAHHPTEIRATLDAARTAYPERRIVAVFQPHLPSRTRDLMDDFADALTNADAVYVTDIYLAREQPIPGVSSEILAQRIQALKPSLPVSYVPDKKELPDRLAADVRAGDLVLTMGAGDIRAAGAGLLAAL